MKNEICFFTDNEDENDLVSFLSDHSDKITKESNLQWLFDFDESSIQLLRCFSNSREIVIGRLAIQTHNSSKGCRRAESVFREIKKYIMSTFENNLYVRNLKIKSSSKAVKNVWIGKSALDKKITNNIELKQSINGLVVFELKGN